MLGLVTEPIVGIVMGSDSDLPVMRAAVEALREFDLAAEVRVLSAHRTPDETIAWAREAAERGLRVLIAGAGGAAHLPGVVAAVTSLPVIGVPISATRLDGWDALLAIAQMPAGVPVACVAIDGARNAGLLAARILAAGDDGLRARIDAFRADLAAKVRDKDAKVRAEFDLNRPPRPFGFG
ncbi:MAG: 5-(carboxyamino)imidazole ribonucleotide mutase [Egibacteraceae bacterium]